VLAPMLPELLIGSADLTPSNKTNWKGCVDFQKTSPHGRYFRYGVREFAMAAIANGMHAYGGIIPATATFLNFIEYMFPAVRLTALSHFQQLFIMTHDSIGLAEDGPTHQPIEAVAMCRATPNVAMFRPADGNETAGSYACALLNKKGPSVLALTRQNLPHLAGSSADKVALGGYVIMCQCPKGHPDVTLVATGSEVSLVVEAAKLLTGVKVRVVSMPCTQLFDAQPVAYRRSVIPPGSLAVSVEAASIQGWERYAHCSLGMTSYGASAPIKDVMEHFGFTPAKVAARVTEFRAELRDAAAALGGGARPALLPTHFASTKGNMPKGPILAKL
jgi:transketolase